MAFVAVRPLRASLCVAQHPGLGFRRTQQVRGRVAVPALRSRLLSVRCNASEGESERSEAEDVKKDLKTDSADEEFGGWSAAEPEDESQGSSWKAGLLRIGAGFVLAIGVSLISYTYWQKQGRTLAPNQPSQTSTQESKAVQEAPQQQEALSKASSNEADHGDEAAFVDVSERNDDDYIDEELDEGNYSDKHQDQGEEKEQGDSNQVDAEETDDIDSDSQGRDLKMVVLTVVDRMQEMALL